MFKEQQSQKKTKIITKNYLQFPNKKKYHKNQQYLQKSISNETKKIKSNTQYE